MSKLLISHYLNDLARLKQVGGTHRESVVSEAFKDLLKGYARSHDLVFIPQYQFKTPANDLRTSTARCCMRAVLASGACHPRARGGPVQLQTTNRCCLAPSLDFPIKDV